MQISLQLWNCIFAKRQIHCLYFLTAHIYLFHSLIKDLLSQLIEYALEEPCYRNHCLLKDVQPWVLHTFFSSVSFFEILHHISSSNVEVELNYIFNWIMVIKFHMISIRRGALSWVYKVFRRKIIIFLFWNVNSVVDFDIYFCTERGLFCFVKCFKVISNHLLNQFFINFMVMLWHTWRICLRIFWKMFSIFAFLWYLNINIIDPHIKCLFLKTWGNVDHSA